jgi:hypothetical protein
VNEPENKYYGDLFSLMQRTIDIFMTDVGKNDLIIPNQYNEALQYIDSVKRKMINDGTPGNDVNRYFTIGGNPYEGKVPLKLFTIRPDAPLGGGPGGLNFDSAEMKGMLAKGEGSAVAFSGGLGPGDVTWV